MPYLILISALAMVALGVLIGSELRRRRPPLIDRSPPAPVRRAAPLEDDGRAAVGALAVVALLIGGALATDWLLEALRRGVWS